MKRLERQLRQLRRDPRDPREMSRRSLTRPPLRRIAARGWVTRTAMLGGVLVASLVSTTPALGQFTRDRSAREKISETITNHYLKMNFGEAEEVLLGVVRACEDKCRPSTVAKAWMYIGVVRGSGKGDQHSAREAFDTAFGQDPRVELDEALATAETTRTFEAARKARPDGGRAVPLIGASTMTDEDDELEENVEPAAKPKASGLACTPSAREVQTRRAVPFDCRADGEVVRMSLRYQEHGEADWKTIDMVPTGSSFRAQLPCEATMDSGNINFFIVATDSVGDPLDTLGSKSAPLRLKVDPKSRETPAFPGEEPPARCEERVLCPPDFPGCEDTMSDSTGEEEAAASTAYKTDWLGVHFAADVGFIGGSNVCATENLDFDCFDGESPYPAELPANVQAPGVPGERGDAYPGTGIGAGASGGTLRALLSYDHAFSDSISAGARLGYAFGGGPKTIDGRSFLPVHAEGRLSYWIRGLSATGLRPYVHLGGGLAQVDIKKGEVTVRDCSQEASRADFLDCIAAEDAYDSANQPSPSEGLPTMTLDAYRKLGNAFVTTGGGVLFALGGDAALQVNLNAMLMLPSVGLVLQPSIGLVYGL